MNHGDGRWSWIDGRLVWEVKLPCLARRELVAGLRKEEGRGNNEVGDAEREG